MICPGRHRCWAGTITRTSVCGVAESRGKLKFSTRHFCHKNECAPLFIRYVSHQLFSTLLVIVHCPAVHDAFAITKPLTPISVVHCPLLLAFPLPHRSYYTNRQSPITRAPFSNFFLLPSPVSHHPSHNALPACCSSHAALHRVIAKLSLLPIQ
jgi:hypothetical protein